MFSFGKSTKSNHEVWCDAMVSRAQTKSTRCYSVKVQTKRTGVRRYSQDEVRAMMVQCLA